LIDATANSGWSICCKIFESLTEKNRKWFTYQYYNIEPNRVVPIEKLNGKVVTFCL
jgi:membrane-bound lytic murein transglycosylase MltF